MDAREQLNEFLISLGVDTYNSQFNRRTKNSDWEFDKLPQSDKADLGYDLTSKLDPELRLRLYLDVSNSEGVESFINTTDSTVMDGVGNLKDEIFLTRGYISDNVIRNRNFNIKAWIIENSVNRAIMVSDTEFLLTEADEIMMREEARAIDME